MNTYFTRPVLFRSSPFAARRQAALGADFLFAAALDEVLSDFTDGRIALDLLEEKEAYVLRAELPGVKRDQVSLELQEDVLALGVKAQADSQHSDRSRTLRLPGLVVEDKIEAKLEDGVLTVRLPKRLPPAPEKVTITVR